MKEKNFVDYFKNENCKSCPSKFKGNDCNDIDECSNGYDDAFEAGYKLANDENLFKELKDEKLFKEIDFKEYSVIIRNHSLTFIDINKKQITIPTHFDIAIDDISEGGKIEIRFRDRWGSQMIFIHYQPSDLKGMFDFILRGYKLLKD